VTALDWNMTGLLRNCKSVVDLGCGWLKWEAYCPKSTLYFGWDVSLPEESQWPQTAKDRLAAGNLQVVTADIMEMLNVTLQPAPSAILLMDVIEHLEKSDGQKLLAYLEETYPDTMLILFTPDGFHPNPGYDDPTHPQFHRSGWTAEDFPGYQTVHCPDFHGEGLHALLAIKRVKR
jgi:hypothetical protein